MALTNGAPGHAPAPSGASPVAPAWPVWTPPNERPARLAPAVTEQLLRRIAFGEFPPGSNIPTEPNLALQFKVSRTVVRESVRALEEKRVLSARQGRGTVVSERDQWSPFDPLIISVRLESEPSTKLFRDLAEIRMALECQLAGAAALNATPDMLAAIEQVLDRQDQLDISVPEYTDLDIAFHQLVADASGNEIGRGIMATLGPALLAMRHLTNEIPDAKAHTTGLHRRVLACLVARDPQGASAAMAEHLSWSREHLLSLKSQ